MKNGLFGAFIFALGAAAGSFITWKLVKDKYERIAQEEIDSVKEVFSVRTTSSEDSNESEVDSCSDSNDAEDSEEPVYITIDKDAISKSVDDEVMTKFNDIVKKHRYVSDYEDDNVGKKPNRKKEYNKNWKEDGVEVIDKPYVIHPDMFGEFEDEGYEKETLVLYADGVLAYWDSDEIVEDPKYLIGDDYMNHFGEYEEDVVYVRHEKHQIDYEILRDLGYYSDKSADKKSDVEVQ